MSSTKYTLLTVEPQRGGGGGTPSSSSSSSSSPPSPSISPSIISGWPTISLLHTRFYFSLLVVTILTLAIFGFRCLTYVSPSPCYNNNNPAYVAAAAADNRTAGASTPPTTTTRRLPDAIIIGVRKCGTRALLTFLNRHPFVRAAGKEIHYFDKKENYNLGDEWYRLQMPLAEPHQVVVEKTPGYFVEPEAPARVKETLGTNVKLVLIVRDPVERTVSDYVQLRIKYDRTRGGGQRRGGGGGGGGDGGGDDYGGGGSGGMILPPMPPFEKKVLNSNGNINVSYKPIRIGQYDVHLRRWLDVFPRRQILVVDGENFVKDPFQSLVEVETFLGLEHWLTRDHFVLNSESGFYCLKTDDHKTIDTPGIIEQGCLAKSKGRPHPPISDRLRKKLTLFYRKNVSRFFQKIGKRFDDWPTIQTAD